MEDASVTMLKMRLASMANGRKKMTVANVSDKYFQCTNSFYKQVRKENVEFIIEDLKQFIKTLKIGSYIGSLTFNVKTGKFHYPSYHKITIIYDKI